MANADLSSFGAAFVQAYADEVIHTINRRAALLSLLMVDNTGEGKNHGWEAYLSDGANAGAFSEGATKSTTASDVPSQALLSFASYDANFKLTHHAINAAAGSKNPRQLRNLFNEQLKNALSKLASTVNGALYTGDGTSGACVGLATAVDSTTAYAGLDRGTYPKWASTESDSSSAPLTTTQIENDLATISDACGMRPNFMVCTSSVRNKLKALFADSRRWSNPTSSMGRTILDNSADVIVIDGCTVVEDKDCTANAIYYLNSDEVRLVTWPNIEGNGDDVPLVFGGPETSLQKLSRGLRMYELGKTGSFRQFSVELYFLLQVRNPNACGKRINIG